MMSLCAMQTHASAAGRACWLDPYIKRVRVRLARVRCVVLCIPRPSRSVYRWLWQACKAAFGLSSIERIRAVPATIHVPP